MAGKLNIKFRQILFHHLKFINIGVNQAYVSKFLRGEFFDLSENGKTLIYKWFLRFTKNPNIFRK